MLIYDKADHSLPVIKDLELVLSILKFMRMILVIKVAFWCVS